MTRVLYSKRTTHQPEIHFRILPILLLSGLSELCAEAINFLTEEGAAGKPGLWAGVSEEQGTSEGR